MTPTRQRFFAKFVLALALLAGAALPGGAIPDAEAYLVISPAEKCRNDLAVQTRRYLERILFARIQCENRIIIGELPASTDCLSGRGDNKLDKRLTRAEDKLTNLTAACAGVNLELLGFPGTCEDTSGGNFDTSDFVECAFESTQEIAAVLLSYYYPPDISFYRGSEATCLKGSPLDAASSFRRDVRVRERCLLQQYVGLVDQDVDCRAQIQPYGPGTGDQKVDRGVARAYIKLLGAIPYACVNFQLNDLDYQANCPDQTGGLFTIFDLKQCFFHIDNIQSLEELAIIFPTDPICGDGNVQGDEECDLGLAGNSDTKPNTCRTNCRFPVCHDGVLDDAFGEECDDGNTVDNDGCSGECVIDKCGDGSINNTPCSVDPSVPTCEECDNGEENSNTSDQCRATGPNACKNPKCGDSIIDIGLGEECDDGNLTPGDGCSQFCIVEFCGDDFINNKPCSTNPSVPTCEECDDGVDNANTPNACRTNCKNPKCGDGIVDDGETCDDGNSIDDDECTNTCSVCGDGIKAPLEECDTDSDVCPAGEGCTSGCKCEPACPSVGELVLSSGVGGFCATNAECATGTCEGDGRCHTSTRLDSGWTGLAHNADINDGIRTRGFLECESHGPVCGECNVVGVDPSIDSCRCANDTRAVCDDPFNPASSQCPACVGGPRVNGPCAANADCSAGSCSLRCNNNAAVTCSTNTDCPGSFCPTSGTKCSNGFTCSANADCIGTCTALTACDCYFGAPFPLSSGGTPACVVNRFAQDITGTANVDLGEGKITANLRTRVYLGISTTNPCPTCGGKCSNSPTTVCERSKDCPAGGTCEMDPTPDDNIRGGTCVNGANAGKSCDVTGVNTSFPAYPASDGDENGGGYSLDCLPDSGKNISGTGLIINLTQSTGVSEMFANVSCQGQNPGLNCPCLQCSGDASVPCNTDAQCGSLAGSCALAATIACSTNTTCEGADVGPCKPFGQANRCSSFLNKLCTTNTDCASVNVGPCNPSTCSAKGLGSTGTFPLPNQCNDLLCSDVGDGLGKCTTGPDEKSCDGVVKANGDGILACNALEDCLPSAVGVDAGTCSLVARRSCFLDPIVAVGAPDPSEPIGAATFCVPPTSNSAINDVAGLPGPARIVNQAAAMTFCGSDTSKQYIPGVGGCLQD